MKKIVLLTLIASLALPALASASTVTAPAPPCLSGYTAKRERITKHVRVRERKRVHGHIVYVTVRKTRHPKVWKCVKTSVQSTPTASAPGAELRVTTRVDRPTYIPGPSPLTLVNAQGQPVAGRWQALVDAAQVPVWHGEVIFDSSDRDIDHDCGGGGAEGGCFSNYDPPEIWTSADRAGAFGLYHEMGHLFDYEALTDADRAMFMHIWRINTPASMSTEDAWWRNESMADALSSGPPGEWFAEGYRLCATYGAWTWQTAFDELIYQYGYPAQNAWGVSGRSARWSWTIRAQRETCSLINSVALRVPK